MAIDMMVDSAKLDREMLATANALREKGKTEAEIPWEDEIGFEQAVLAIKGGADLNFEVVGGTTKPTNPHDNTIWINTSTEISGWTFDSEAPSNPAPGMVWIQTSTAAIIEFNALKENSIKMRLKRANQYLNGAWSQADGLIYQNGEWKVIEAILYNVGNECLNLTGGWEAKVYVGTIGTLEKGSASMRAVQTGKGASVICGIKNNTALDLSGYSTITFNVTSANGGDVRVGIMSSYDFGDSFASEIIAYQTVSGAAVYSVPIDVDSAFPFFSAFGADTSGRIEIDRIVLE